MFKRKHLFMFSLQSFQMGTALGKTLNCRLFSLLTIPLWDFVRQMTTSTRVHQTTVLD